MSTIKIMTFNTQHCLNYIERRIDFPLMAKTVRDLNADVVGLNEMRGDGPDPEYTPQTETLSAISKLHHYFFAPAIRLEEGLYGNGLISRIPIVERQVIPVPPPFPNPNNVYYENRCLLRAVLENGLTVLVIHFGLTPVEAENAVRTVLPFINKEKTVLMGDFNVTPDVPVLAPIRERMTDTAELFSSPLLSFPSDAPDRKIDYIFVSRDLKVLSADIPPVVASDHRPCVAQIEL